MTVIDVSQYNILNRCNDYQSAPILVPNLRSILMKLYFNNSTSINNYQPLSNISNSKIQKVCKWISEYLMALAPLA